MNLMEAIEARHSVRLYDDKPIAPETVEELWTVIDQCNEEGDLHIQLVLDDPEAFRTLGARFVKLSGARNYIAMIGKAGDDLDERCGYYGEKIVLRAQQLGLNTCWIGATYNKKKTNTEIEYDEKQVLVIAVGYGKTDGHERKSKSMTDVSDESDVSPNVPRWYKNGIKAALLAPTAINQQKFTFTREGNKVSVKAGVGPFSKVDLGIVKLHFEIGAGIDNFEWI